jgi:sugar phosphate isomerase/epimerase
VVTTADRRPLILAAGSMLDQTATVLIDVAAHAGFDGVGVRLSGEHAGDDPSSLRVRAADQGITIHDVEVYRIDASASDPDDLILRAASLGAEALLVVSDLPDRNATVDALDAVTDRCRRAGLRVGLEYMAWTTPSTPLDALQMAREVGCELVVDVLHHVRVGAGRTELVEIVHAGVLGWLQLCDAPATAPDDLLQEARHGRVAPGRGELPVGELLASVPVGTPISVEVQSDTLRSLPPGERARLLYDATRSVIAGER